MSTEDNNVYQGEEKEKRRRGGAILIILVLLLLGSVGFNIYQYVSTEKKEQVLNEELVSSQDLRNELQKELEDYKSQLSEYKGKANKLDTMIAQKENELLEKAQRIEKLLRDNKISYNKYLQAKDEIEKWKYYADKYVKQIDELNEQNKKLVAQNQDLKEEVKTKVRELDKLTDENVMLNNKVSLGAQLKAENMTVTGVRFKSSGKERETSKAKQIEKLKICFDVPENHIADNGNREIFIRVIDPKGQTISVESLGSGKFSTGGEEALYTTKDEIFYDNMPKNYCLYWGFANQVNLEEGQYKIELFTEGYKMGERNFTIK